MNRADWLESLANSATPNIDECIEKLGDTIDWLYLLKDTEQDPQWHAEGNVHIHTGLVLAELYKLLDDTADHIVGWQRQAIVLATLLHDIAKPVRTRRYEQDGIERIGAPQHAEAGRCYLAFKLPELELPFHVVWTVLNLVGEHHTPKKLVVRNSDKTAFYSLARQANTELLYWLEIADIRGRICPEPEVQLQHLEEFRMFAEEYDVWTKELDVRTDLKSALSELPPNTQNYVYAHAIQQMESGKITMPEEALATTYQHRDEHSHLVVLCGPSGSGKSSWQTKNYPGYTIVSLDNLRMQFNGDSESQNNKGQIIQYAKEQLRASLRSHGNVIWDATNLRKDFRSIVCTLGRDYHALVTLVVFLLPEKTLYKNNRKRQRSVPHSILEKQLSTYQIPMLTESHQFQVVDSNGDLQFNSGYYLDT